jgi:hypothetical protein
MEPIGRAIGFVLKPDGIYLGVACKSCGRRFRSLLRTAALRHRSRS